MRKVFDVRAYSRSTTDWKVVLQQAIETTEDAMSEDRVRARILLRSTTLGEAPHERSETERELLESRALPHLPLLLVPQLPGRVLLTKLRRAAGGEVIRTLGSSVYFRQTRLEVLEALFNALSGFPDEDLRVVTVIKSSQRVHPRRLLGTTARRLKAQFDADLKASGVSLLDGPLIGFLHSEFESVEGVFVFHWHLVTTADKASALKLALARLTTYPVTPTGSPAIVVQEVKNRTKQLTYLLQSFWPMRGVREVNGRPLRDRKKCRIAEPYGSLALIWMDRQRLGDMSLFNDCWSRKNGGGPPKMRALHKAIFER